MRIMHIILDIGKLRDGAKASGIELQDVARRARVSPGTLSRLKPGRGRVSTLTQLNLALAQLLMERRAQIDALLPVHTPGEEEKA